MHFLKLLQQLVTMYSKTPNFAHITQLCSQICIPELIPINEKVENEPLGTKEYTHIIYVNINNKTPKPRVKGAGLAMGPFTDIFIFT